nr:hypothetical protein [uncultured Arsenicibacter sp.]
MKTYFFLLSFLIICLTALPGTLYAQACHGVTVAADYRFYDENNSFHGSSALALDKAGFIYVVNPGNHRVVKYAQGSTSYESGTTVAGGNGQGDGANQLAYPNRIAIDDAGFIYITDAGNYRVQKFPPNATSASNGTTVAGGNGYGDGANQFKSMAGIAVDQNGFIYVVDRTNNRVQKFAPNSTSASNGTTVAGGNGYGEDANQLAFPYGVAIDNAGFIYVTDRYNARVQKYAPNATSAGSGTTVAGGNGIGPLPDQFGFPIDITADKAGFIYVADAVRHSIQKFGPNPTSASNGTIVAGGNGFGSGSDQMKGPEGVVVDAAGFIYVSDNANARIQRYAQTPPPAPAIQQFVVDESRCPVRLRGAATGSSFVLTGPGNYVFSQVYRQSGSQPIATITINAPGNYQLNVVSTNDCGTSGVVSQTVTVNRACP